MENIDFYNAEAHAGTSYWPFIGFMLFIIGFIVTFIGIVKIVSAKHQFNLFYDDRDKKNLAEPKYNKEKRIGIILVVAGIVMMVASFLVERL